jgi:hypothetical protein
MIVTPECDRLDGRGAPPDPLDRTVLPSDAWALKGRYEEYCRRQVTLLLEIIPREAVRPLYRRARIWATERGLHEAKDPMSTLRGFCRELLPLPPLEVWLADCDHRVANPGAGVEWGTLSDPMKPIAVDVRRIEHDSEPWHGTLEVYRGGDAWRGLIRFQRDGEEDFFRTGEIFREDDLQDLRNRFRSLTVSTMSAFLRSTLP